MIRLQYLALVDREVCTGCGECERICPSGAITMVEEKASIDPDRCIDCQRCIDRCDKVDAIRRASRPSEVTRHVDSIGIDPLLVKTICGKAGVLPDMPICGCLRVTGRETVAAILKGARTPEDLCAATGLRAGCGLYCVTRIFQLFAACGIDLETPKDRRWVKLTLSLADIPEETVASIDKAYPQCHVGDDWRKVTQRRTPPARKEGSDV